VSPQRTDVIQDASIAVGATPTDSVLIVSATVTDASGAVSEIMTKAIPVNVPQPNMGAAHTAAVQSQELVRSKGVAEQGSAEVRSAGEPEDAARPTRRVFRSRSGR